MQPRSGDRTARGTWYLMFAAFIWFELLLVVFGAVLAANYASSGRPAPGADALAAVCYLVTPLAVVASIYWSRAKLAAAEEVDPQKFTRDSVVALGIAELGLMFAVIAFMRTNPVQIVFFGAIVMTIDFLIILKAGARYWNARTPEDG